MKTSVVFFLTLFAPLLRGSEGWDIREVAEHALIFESKDYSAVYSFSLTGVADADIYNPDGMHPRYTWRISDSGLLVILSGPKTVITFRKIRASENRYQVEENGHPMEYRRVPFPLLKSEEQLAWKPDPKDVEALRQALLEAVPAGYKVSPYFEMGAHKGIAIYYNSSRTDSGLPTSPHILVEFCPKMEVAEIRQWRTAYRDYMRTIQNLPNDERDRKRQEFSRKMPEFPAAYFRSLGIAELPEKPDDMASEYQVTLTPTERENFQRINAAILKLITVYKEEPNQPTQSPRRKD